MSEHLTEQPREQPNPQLAADPTPEAPSAEPPSAPVAAMPKPPEPDHAPPYEASADDTLALPAAAPQPVVAPEPGTSIHWYGPDTPSDPQPPADQPVAGGRRRWSELGLAVIVAAAVAAGTTVGVMHLRGEDTASVSANTSVSRSTNPAGTTAGPVSASEGQGVDWPKVAAAVEPSVVAISTKTQFSGSQGSGVVLDAKGHVLTNNHVVADAAQGGTLTVTLSDGRSFQASIVGTDPSTDLAVILMKGATDLTPATLGDSDAVAVGAPAMAVGNPLGLAGTVTTGIVSALDRPVTTSDQSQNGASSGDNTVVTNAIQTDAAVNPGNSGGALVDATGRVIGIPSSIASLGQSQTGQGGSIGLGFSIPINEAKSIADQLLADGKAEHPFLGVSLKDGTVTQGPAQRATAVVAQVSADSPAQTAGLAVGDSITAVDGESVNSSESLVAQIRERSVGDAVDLTVARGGKERKITAKLTKRSSGG